MELENSQDDHINKFLNQFIVNTVYDAACGGNSSKSADIYLLEKINLKF